MKHLAPYDNHQHRIESFNEFFTFKNKNKDVEFAEELLKTLIKDTSYSIGSNTKGYTIIFRDKSVSTKKRKEFGITGFLKEVYDLFVSQNGERREVDCPQSTKKKIYEFVDKKFKN